MNMVGINRQPLHAFVGNAILYFMTEWKVGHKKSLELGSSYKSRL